MVLRYNKRVFLVISFLLPVSLLGGWRDVPGRVTFSKENDQPWSLNVCLGASAAAAVGSWYATDKTSSPTIGLVLGMTSGLSVLAVNNVFDALAKRRRLTRHVFNMHDYDLLGCFLGAFFGICLGDHPAPKKNLEQRLCDDFRRKIGQFGLDSVINDEINALVAEGQ